MKVFTFHADAAHGWLEADWTDLKALGLNPSDFSKYSYRKGNTFYLEEDADASKFIAAWEAKNGRKMEIKDEYQHNSFIRSLPRI